MDLTVRESEEIRTGRVETGHLRHVKTYQKAAAGSVRQDALGQTSNGENGVLQNARNKLSHTGTDVLNKTDKYK